MTSGQDQALEPVRREAARVRQLPSPTESGFIEELKAYRDQSTGLHSALRDWIAPILPSSRATLDAELPILSSRVNADLNRNGLIGVGNFLDKFKPGFVTGIEFLRTPEDPDKLVVAIGTSVPCGSNEAAYVYDYSQGTPRRVMESHSSDAPFYGISGVHFSRRDRRGDQLVLILRYAVQCGSSWNVLSYELSRISSTTGTVAPILSAEHGIWFGAENPYQVRLDPDELLIELRDNSIDGNNRAHVLHYVVNGSSAERVDPVALHPSDFVDEWLTRPWPEMESRSAESAREDLKKWHDLLADGFLAGEFNTVRTCTDRPDQWQVGIDLDWIHGKGIPEPLTVFFLVQQSERYRFTMNSVSFLPREGCPVDPDGCPDESPAEGKEPTLFPARPNPQ